MVRQDASARPPRSSSRSSTTSPIPDLTDPDFSVSGGLQRTNGHRAGSSPGSPIPGLTIGASATWLELEIHRSRRSRYRPQPLWLGRSAREPLRQLRIPERRSAGIRTRRDARQRRQAIGVLCRRRRSSTATAPTSCSSPGYERVDLNFFYKGLPNWDLSLHVRNVTDETYIERFRDVERQQLFRRAAQRALPRAVSLLDDRERVPQQETACSAAAAGVLRMRGRRRLSMPRCDFARRGSRRCPSDADAHRHLGLIHAALGKRWPALQAAKRACELAPDDPRCWSDLGRVHAMFGELDDAATCFAEAVALDARYADGWHNLGLALAQARTGASRRSPR